MRISRTRISETPLWCGGCHERAGSELEGDPVVWEVVGLLHDADYEKTKDQMDRHTLLLGEILADEDLED